MQNEIVGAAPPPGRLVPTRARARYRLGRSSDSSRRRSPRVAPNRDHGMRINSWRAGSVEHARRAGAAGGSFARTACASCRRVRATNRRAGRPRPVAAARSTPCAVQRPDARQDGGLMVRGIGATKHRPAPAPVVSRMSRFRPGPPNSTNMCEVTAKHWLIAVAGHAHFAIPNRKAPRHHPGDMGGARTRSFYQRGWESG